MVLSGPAAAAFVALSNFVVAFALQRSASPEEFGAFAIVQVLQLFGIGLSNAIFASPVVIALADDSKHAEVVRSFFKVEAMATLVGAAVSSLAVWGVTGRIGFSVAAAVFFVLSWNRWFFRALELASLNRRSPVLADLMYGVVVLLPSVCLARAGEFTLLDATLLQVAGSLGAFLMLGSGIGIALRGILTAPVAEFSKSFKLHGSWSAVGVLTTEATGNAYNWIVGFVLGPAALAPIAAMNLFFRPLPVVLNAMTQYERPRMARAWGSGDTVALGSIKRWFTTAALGTWVVNLMGVSCLLLFLPGLIGNGQYSEHVLRQAAFMTALSHLARALRGSSNASLQACGKYRELARTTAVSAPISVGVVLVAVFAFPSSVIMLMLGVLLADWIAYALMSREAVAALVDVPPMPKDGYGHA